MSATTDNGTAAGTATETHEFSAEVGRLLDLVVHALYSDREIFLRELVANAADATDRRRFEALTDPALTAPEGAKVRIVPDKAARTLLIADDGIGMTREELIANLGTIARSGTRAFGQSLAAAKPEDRPSLIGQFGVGFYSAFMVAGRVEVTSRHAGAEAAWTWASEGGGAFTLARAERERPGTDVLLHLREDATEFLEPVRLETIVRKWADHIALPVTIARDGKDVPANEGTALWRKPKSEVSEQEYAAFYRHLGHWFDQPRATLHWRAEGMLDFAALLFIPGARPFDPLEGERESRVRLHVRRMFITDRAGLLPPWLRFVQGVVDTEDLPLNVSREMLQTTPVLGRIRKAVTSRVLSELKSRAADAEAYARLWEDFGAIIKEGLWEDPEHRAEIAALARFRSSAQEGWVSLADYVARMQPGQEAIYYLTGEDAAALRNSPQIEGFRARGIEVLLLADPIDGFWPERLGSFEDRKLLSVTQEGALAPREGDEAADVGPLLKALEAALDGRAGSVRATHRLVESAVALAAPPAGPDLMTQRLLRRSGRAMPAPPPVLEINPAHPLVRTLAARAAAGEELGEAPATLFDLAQVQDGELPADPSGFARRVTALLAGSLASAPSGG